MRYRAYAESTACRSSCAGQVKDLTSKIVEKDLQVQAAIDSSQALKMELRKKEKELTESVYLKLAVVVHGATGSQEWLLLQ